MPLERAHLAECHGGHRAVLGVGRDLVDCSPGQVGRVRLAAGELGDDGCERGEEGLDRVGCQVAGVVEP